MIRSMTGFGKGECAACGVIFSVEISSVNRKQLELRFTLPREFSAIEIEMRQWIAPRISRGSVNVRLMISGAGELSTVRINSVLLNELTTECRKLASQFNDISMPNAAQLLALPGVIESVPLDAENPELNHAVKNAVLKALDAFIAMRDREGVILAEDLSSRREILEKLLAAIKPLAAAIPGQLKTKLMEKIVEEGLPVDVNDERLLKEVLFYADKADVTEEITRLESHFRQFDAFLKAEEPVGRSLDFLLQEMFREITTLGNKAGCGEITPLIVKFKSELEKLREQIQNVE